MGGACSTYGGNLRERNHLEDTGLDGRIILRWIFRKWNEGVRTGCSWLKVTTGGGQYVSR